MLKYLSLIGVSNNFLIVAFLKIFLSIAFVHCNKYVFIEFGFPNLTLTSIQFLATFLAVLAAFKTGVLTRKKISYQDVAVSCFLLAAFAIFTNLSIDYNAIEVSQSFRFAQIPLVLVLFVFLNKKQFSNKVKLAAVFISLPIALNCYYDYTFDLLGVVFACLAVAFGSVYYLWINKKQTEDDVSQLQLLFYQAPICGFVMFVILPAFDNNFELNGLFDSSRPLEEWILIAFTCLVAAGYYLTLFIYVDTSNIFLSQSLNNIVNLVSLVSLTLVGYFQFDEPLEIEQIGCLIVLIIGVLVYSKLRSSEETAATEKHIQI